MAPSPYIFIISIGPVDMNKYARFDEIPSMTLKEIKETKCYGRTEGRTGKQYTHPQTQFGGGGGGGGGGSLQLHPPTTWNTFFFSLRGSDICMNGYLGKCEAISEHPQVNCKWPCHPTAPNVFYSTLLTSSFGNCLFAFHIFLKQFQQNVIRSSFCIPKVIKSATKILKIG